MIKPGEACTSCGRATVERGDRETGPIAVCYDCNASWFQGKDAKFHAYHRQDEHIEALAESTVRRFMCGGQGGPA